MRTVFPTILVSLLVLCCSFSCAWIPSTNMKLIKHPLGIRTKKSLKAQTVKHFMGKKGYDYTGFVGNSTDKLPIFRLHINETYNLAPSEERVTELIEWTKNNGITDLWVVSHGWLTTAEDAFSKNYELLFAEFDALIRKPEHEEELKGRKFGIIGITWNSLTRKAEEDFNKLFAIKTQESSNPIEKLRPKFLKSNRPLNLGEIQTSGFTTDEQGHTAEKESSKALEDFETISEEFKEELLGMFGTDEELNEVRQLIESESNESYNGNIFNGIDAVVRSIEDIFTEGPTGSGADFAARSTDIASERAAVAGGSSDIDILRYLTFRIMKGRAAQSGLRTLSSVMSKLRKKNSSLHIHLVGHSFGALLVSAAANDGETGDFASLTLLQGAFSKNAFSPSLFYKPRPGMFLNVTRHETVKGPITITHTKNDGSLRTPYFAAATFYRGLPFRGVELPNFQPKSFNWIEFLLCFQLRAIGDEGVANVDNQRRKWSELRVFDPSNIEDEIKFHDILANDAINDHNDVWSTDIARLLLKIAKATATIKIV